jgi:predicted amidohydrolase YtcJ
MARFVSFTICFLLFVLANISAAAQTAADLILVNANIRTLDAKKPRAEAMAVADGKMIAVGSNTAIRRFARPQTRIIDARGRLVLPGFNDSHVHFTAIGNQFSHLDLRRMASRFDILAEIARYSAFLPKGRWIIAGGLEHEKLEPAGPIPLEMIDKASPDNPLMIFVEGGKSIVTNSAALARAGITPETKDPSDGVIVRDHADRPTGILTGNAAAIIRRHVPSDHAKNWSEIAETASNYAASLGVTSVQDVHSDDLVEVYRQLDKAGRLKTRVYECLGIDSWQKASLSDIGLVRGGCVKGTTFGIEEEIDDLRRKIASADKAGLQVMIHAIGARSNRNAIDAFEYAAKVNGRRDRRFRMEHAARTDVDDLPRFVRSNVIMSMQPHLFYSGPDYGENYRRILDAGVIMALGSDASMTDFNPLYGISAAVNSGVRSLTVEEAVRAYTQTAAYAEFQEKVKGTLEIGKAADFVILTDDIFSIDTRRIASAKVLLTVVDGKIVFNKL